MKRKYGIIFGAVAVALLMTSMSFVSVNAGTIPGTSTSTGSTVILSITVVGSGSVIKNPDQASYSYGSVVKLTATASAGWSFSCWSGAISGNQNPMNITMNGNKAVNATFVLNPADSGGANSILPSPDSGDANSISPLHDSGNAVSISPSSPSPLGKPKVSFLGGTTVLIMITGDVSGIKTFVFHWDFGPGLVNNTDYKVTELSFHQTKYMTTARFLLVVYHAPYIAGFTVTVFRDYPDTGHRGTLGIRSGTVYRYYVVFQ